jgi:hypothetical protein
MSLIKTVLLVLLSTSVFWTVPANAKKSRSYELVWQLEQSNYGPQEALATKFLDLTFNTIYQTRLLPDRLFQADSDLKSQTGTPLLGKGTQLVGLEFSTPLVCTLFEGSSETISSEKRVCLLDENGDGVFDSYFLRPLHSNLLSYSGKWYALQGKIPKKMDSLLATGFSLSEISNKLFKNQIPFSLVNASISKTGEKLSMDAIIDGGAWLKYRCVLATDKASTKNKENCSPPGFDIRYLKDEGGRRFLMVEKLSVVTKVKFRVSVSMVGIVGGIVGAELY